MSNLEGTSETWRQRTERGHARIRATSRQLVLDDLLGRLGEVSAGSAEILADRWAPMFDNARPAVIADYINRHLADEDIRLLCRGTDGPGHPLPLVR